MKPSWWIALALVCAGVPIDGRAQPLIDANRRIDWSQAGVPGGIPNRTKICATLNPGATHTQINDAIAACSGGVVFLNSGVYTLAGGITFAGRSEVTLRGAGPTRTILKFVGADPCGGLPAAICVRGKSSVGVGSVPEANVRKWIAGYGKGSTRITLSSTTGIAPGTILVLDQLDDTADTGAVVVSGQKPNAFSIEGYAPGRPNRTQSQFVTVVAVKGNEATISPGLYMPNWRASQSPEIWFWGTSAETALLNGIENITLDYWANSVETAGVMFWNAYSGWIRNVKSLKPNRNHVWLYQTARIEVRDSYFFGTKNAATESYGVECFMTSDNLIVNNIFEHVTTPIMMGPGAGTVAAYNYMTDMFYSANRSWMAAAIAGSHDTGTGMNLFEGNEANAFAMDLYHGPGAFPTVFRNYLTGRDGDRTKNTAVINIWAYNRFANVVGNVLGTPGYHTVLESSRGPLGTTGDPYHSIYLLGYSGVEERTSPRIAYDLLAVTTLLRWGNFDYATNQIRWNPAELPGGHPVPRQALPPSLFLESKPAWWGSGAWPGIGPDVTGGQDRAGHAHKNPAHLCFENTPRNADILAFDADACYGPGASASRGKTPNERR